MKTDDLIVYGLAGAAAWMIYKAMSKKPTTVAVARPAASGGQGPVSSAVTQSLMQAAQEAFRRLEYANTDPAASTWEASRQVAQENFRALERQDPYYGGSYDAAPEVAYY